MLCGIKWNFLSVSCTQHFTFYWLLSVYPAEDRAKYHMCMTFGPFLYGMGGENDFMYTTMDQNFLHFFCFQLVLCSTPSCSQWEPGIQRALPHGVRDDGFSMYYIPLFWHIPECPVEGQQFTRCGSTCPPTCTNPNHICTLQCVPHCQCPRGKVIDERKNKCIPFSQCFHSTTPILISDIDIQVCITASLIDKVVASWVCTYNRCNRCIILYIYVQ